MDGDLMRVTVAVACSSLSLIPWSKEAPTVADDVGHALGLWEDAREAWSAYESARREWVKYRRGCADFDLRFRETASVAETGEPDGGEE